MKIAVVTGRGFEAFGGIETYVREIYNRLAENGHQVVIYSRKNKLNEDCKYHYNIRNRILPYLKMRHLDILSHCVFSVFDAWLQDVDIVCYHGFPAALVSWLPLKPGVKKVVVFHGLDWLSPIFNGFLKSGIRLSEIAGSRYSDRLIVVSEYLRQYFKIRRGIDAVCIPPGVMCNGIRPPRKILKWNLEKDRYVLFLGRLTPEKGCHLLIRAFRSLDTEMKLVMAGPTAFTFSDTYDRYLKKAACGDPRIVFTGLVNTETKEELLSNAYLVAYPSLVGGLPLTVLEAMSHKRATLVSSVCDYYDAIKTSSILFKTEDERDLFEKLKLLIQNPVKCGERGNAARDYVAAKYSWEKSALEFERIFNEVKDNGHKKTA
jgi:glycosyltransferase involved in cell wall biosynthesis